MSARASSRWSATAGACRAGRPRIRQLGMDSTGVGLVVDAVQEGFDPTPLAVGVTAIRLRRSGCGSVARARPEGALTAIASTSPAWASGDQPDWARRVRPRATRSAKLFQPALVSLVAPGRRGFRGSRRRSPGGHHDGGVDDAPFSDLHRQRVAATNVYGPASPRGRVGTRSPAGRGPQPPSETPATSTEPVIPSAHQAPSIRRVETPSSRWPPRWSGRSARRRSSSQWEERPHAVWGSRHRSFRPGCRLRDAGTHCAGSSARG